MQTLRARDLLEGLRPEDEQPERKIDLSKNPTLEVLVRGFEIALKTDNGTIPLVRLEKLISAQLRGLSFGAEDIEKLSILAGRYQDAANFGFISGEYLNQCFELCRDELILVRTKHLHNPPSYLSLKTPKTIIIEGNVGRELGFMMERGTIVVRGNTDYHLGDELIGGKLHIYGNGGMDIGRNMSGGEIIIEGNAGPTIGLGMNGGTIHLNGDYIGITPNQRKGSIYHKGKLIMRDGEQIT